jgi:hypothetical protein
VIVPNSSMPVSETKHGFESVPHHRQLPRPKSLALATATHRPNAKAPVGCLFRFNYRNALFSLSCLAYGRPRSLEATSSSMNLPENA